VISCLVADQIDLDRVTYEIAIADVFQHGCKRSTLDRLNRSRHGAVVPLQLIAGGPARYSSVFFPFAD